MRRVIQVSDPLSPSVPPGGQAVPQDSSPSSTCPPAPPPGTNGSSDIMVNFDPDPADLALSSVPGQEAFDPRRHRFSEEELKPQPMIKKARKMLVPNEQKVPPLQMLAHMMSPFLWSTGSRKACYSVASVVSVVSIVNVVNVVSIFCIVRVVSSVNVVSVVSIVSIAS